VLTYLSKGFTIKEIANLMGIKWFTVNDHIKSIYRKLNVSSRAEAAVLASKVWSDRPGTSMSRGWSDTATTWTGPPARLRSDPWRASAI
jgi:hypothetical protein